MLRYELGLAWRHLRARGPLSGWAKLAGWISLYMVVAGLGLVGFAQVVPAGLDPTAPPADRVYELLFGGVTATLGLAGLALISLLRVFNLLATLIIVSVAQGCMALVVVLSLMGGLGGDLAERIRSHGADIQIQALDGLEFSDYEPLAQALAADPEIVGVSPYLFGEVMLRSTFNRIGVKLHGIDPQRHAQTSGLPEDVREGSYAFLDHPEAIAGFVAKFKPKPEPDPELDSDAKPEREVDSEGQPEPPKLQRPPAIDGDDWGNEEGWGAETSGVWEDAADEVRHMRAIGALPAREVPASEKGKASVTDAVDVVGTPKLAVDTTDVNDPQASANDRRDDEEKIADRGAAQAQAGEQLDTKDVVPTLKSSGDKAGVVDTPKSPGDTVEAVPTPDTAEQADNGEKPQHPPVDDGWGDDEETDEAWAGGDWEDPNHEISKLRAAGELPPRKVPDVVTPAEITPLPQVDDHPRVPQSAHAEGPAEPKSVRPPLLIGRELAESLGVHTGDPVQIITPVTRMTPAGMVPGLLAAQISGVFYSGVYELDSERIYLPLPLAQGLLRSGPRVTAIALRVADFDAIDEVKARVQGVLAAHGRNDLEARDYRALNRNLFTAMMLERLAMAIALLFVVVVAAFGILASNLMAVLDRAREIAILKTMGSTDISITRVFVGEGLLLGTLGSLTGVFAGLAICAVLAQTGLPIDEGIFYMERLPIDVRPLEVLGVAVVAIVIVWISSLYPARLAGALAPVDVLRSSEL